MNNIKYWIWFSIFKFKPIYKIIMLNEFKNEPKAIYETNKDELFERLSNKKIRKTELEKIINEIENSKNKSDCISIGSTYLDMLEKRLNDEGVELITFLDDRYPKRLLNIYDFPVAIYVKGNTNILNNNMIAIVGCRMASDYGKIVAKRLGTRLSENNVIVISGLAKGIDSYSHIGCVENKKETIAVLGCGVNVIYPKENKNLYNKILENNGAIISEYFLDESPDKVNFPMRNRIVSGMSNGVIVVEAKKRSGSLITANLALDQGKEIYAVPGNITSKNSKGTNELIRDGAKMVLEINDILEDIDF